MSTQPQQSQMHFGKPTVAVFSHGTGLVHVKSDIEDFLNSAGTKQISSITTYLNQTTGEWSTIIIYQFAL